MLNDRLFFQIAAGLIPALLFGGLVSGVFRPTTEQILRPFRQRVGLLVGVTAAVGFAFWAEVLAIDLATSHGYPATWKVLFVVYGVVGSTAMAGFALVKPWIDKLAVPHERLVSLTVVVVGVLVGVVSITVLTSSITDAQSTLNTQRLACAAAEVHRRGREHRLDSLAIVDAGAARTAELHELADERIKLSQDRGLTSAERKARRQSLQRRIAHAKRRQKSAQTAFIDFLKADYLTYGLDELEPGLDVREVNEIFTRGLGCW